MYDIVMWIIMGAVVIGILVIEGSKATGFNIWREMKADFGATVYVFIVLAAIIIAVRGF
jgi:hypothetical protein